MSCTPQQRRQWQATPVLLPRKSHGRRSLVGCSPWGCEESDMTERLHFHYSLSHIGEGNGNPLQCSCLENPRDREAWWAAVYGVAQSRTRLKQLSNSSSTPQTCKPCNCPATRPKKEPRDRDINNLLVRGSYKSEAKSWSDTPSLWLQEGIFATKGRRRLTFIGEIDIKLAH